MELLLYIKKVFKLSCALYLWHKHYKSVLQLEGVAVPLQSTVIFIKNPSLQHNNTINLPSVRNIIERIREIHGSSINVLQVSSSTETTANRMTQQCHSPRDSWENDLGPSGMFYSGYGYGVSYRTRTFFNIWNLSERAIILTCGFHGPSVKTCDIL